MWGFDSRGNYLNLDIFDTKVPEETLGNTVQERVVSPSSSREQRGSVSLVRKKPRLVRKKRVSSLALGDGVNLEDMTRYASRDLVGHAKG